MLTQLIGEKARLELAVICRLLVKDAHIWSLRGKQGRHLQRDARRCEMSPIKRYPENYMMFVLNSIIYPLLFFSLSVMSDSLQLHRLEPVRLFRPGGFLGKNTGGDSFSFSRGSSQPRDRNCISCKSAALQADCLLLSHWVNPLLIHLVLVSLSIISNSLRPHGL